LIRTTHMKPKSYHNHDTDFDEPSPSLSIYPLSDLALPFDFGHKVFTTKPLFVSALRALNDPIDGGCRPSEVFDLLTQIVEQADSLLPTKDSVQKSVYAKYHDGNSFEVVVCIVMPAAITVLATPYEAALLAEYASAQS